MGKRRKHGNRRTPNIEGSVTAIPSAEDGEWIEWDYDSSVKHAYVRTCMHVRERFELENGLVIYASAYSDMPDALPMFEGIGFYLDSAWTRHTPMHAGFTEDLPIWVHKVSVDLPAREVIAFPWTDYSVPRNPRVFASACRWILQTLQEGTAIETGCMGGHGRTGTLLACLLVMQGIPSLSAIARVHRQYCDLAIESKSQTDLVHAMALARETGGNA